APAVAPLRLLADDGAQLVEGRRGFDLILTGAYVEPALPALGGQLRGKTDSGEEMELPIPPGEASHDADGRHFRTRSRLYFSQLQKPCRELRLSGEIWALPPPRTARKRVELAFDKVMPPLDLGPLRVSAVPAAAPDGSPAIAVTCEWDVSDTQHAL